MPDSFLLKTTNDHPWLKKISIVGLIEGLGGVILMLVLGIQAWAQTELGRKYRLFTGSLAVGVILGVLCYTVFPRLLSFLDDPSAKAWMAFAGLPILLLAFTFFLESVRTKLG